MEINIILLLVCLWLLLKAISAVQLDLYFDRLARQEGQRHQLTTKIRKDD